MEEIHGTEKQKKNEVEKGFWWNNEKEEKNHDLIDHPSKPAWKSDEGTLRGWGMEDRGQQDIAPLLNTPMCSVLMQCEEQCCQGCLMITRAVRNSLSRLTFPLHTL